MNPIVHGMLAWIIAVLFVRELRDRRLVVIAGVIPDIDAILLLVNEDLFYEYHHTIGHSFVFGIPLALLFCVFAKNKVQVLLGSLGTFSVHLIADYFGSNWPIPLLYPLSNIEFTSAGYISYQTMYGVINPLTALVAFALILVIIWVREQSPFEFLSGALDSKLVGLYIYPMKYRCTYCSTLALFACDQCGAKVCWGHMGSKWEWTCSECLGVSHPDRNGHNKRV